MLTSQFWAMRANTHPHLAGKSKKSDRKLWCMIKPLIDQMRGDGEAPRSRDVHIPVPKMGNWRCLLDLQLQSAYGDNGTVNGAFVTCTGTSGKINVLRKSEGSNSQLAFTIEPVGLGTFDFIPLNDIFSSNRISWFSGSGITNSSKAA